MARIIISDDDRISLLVLKNIVDFLGHESVCCSNGIEVVEEFQKNSADLVLLDVNMPGMSGIEACKKIRQTPGGATVPIIMISGLDDEQDVINGLNAGANDYLLKPVKDSHLLAKLKIFLRMSSLHNSDFELAKNHVVFADKYKIKKILGYGSHSVVFFTEDITCENRKTALKLFKESSQINDIYDSFCETAQKLKDIECKNLLKIYDYGLCDKRLFVAMEFAEKGDLSKILRSRTLSQSEAVKLGVQIAEALAKIAEKNIVHFDVKPQNIMMNAENDYLLADFGVASPKSSMTISVKKDIFGTPAYMPPEYLTGDEIYPGLSDIYSLGITLYECLIGTNPFYSDRAVNSMIAQVNLIPSEIYEIDIHFDTELSLLIGKMISKNPDERPSPSETVDKLRSILSKIDNDPNKDFCLFIHKEAIQKKPETKTENEKVQEYHESNEPMPFKIPKQKIYITKNTSSDITAKKSKRRRSIQSISLFDWMQKISLPHIELPVLKLPDLKIIFKTLLLILSIFAAIFAIYSLQKIIFSAEKEEENYLPLNVFKCEKCGFIMEKRSNLEPENCPKCSGKMWTAYECKNCGNVFPLDTLQSYTRSGRHSPYACPKCKSENTEPLKTSEEYLKSKGIGN